MFGGNEVMAATVHQRRCWHSVQTFCFFGTGAALLPLLQRPIYFWGFPASHRSPRDEDIKKKTGRIFFCAWPCWDIVLHFEGHWLQMAITSRHCLKCSRQASLNCRLKPIKRYHTMSSAGIEHAIDCGPLVTPTGNRITFICDFH